MVNALLQSDWLIRMLEKSSRLPAQRLLALFTVLDDMLSSPLAHTERIAPSAQPPALLQQYLTKQAALAGATLPEMLANQLYFMAVSACQETLSHPNSPALVHAKQAAQALIQAQTTREIHWYTIRNYGIVVLGLCVSLIGGFYWHSHLHTTTSIAQPSNLAPPNSPLSQEASPTETAAIYSRLETMKHGDCRLIEALQLPEHLKSIYIENVINGHVTNHRAEQIVVNQLLDQVKCNYTPMLMMRSK